MTRSFLCFVLFIPLKKSWGYDRTDEQVGEEKGVVGVGSGFVGNHELFPLITKFHSLKKKKKNDFSVLIFDKSFVLLVRSVGFVWSRDPNNHEEEARHTFPCCKFLLLFFSFPDSSLPCSIDWLIWLVGFATMFCNLIIYDFAG